MNTSLAVGSLLREIGLEDKDAVAKDDKTDIVSFLNHGTRSESWLRTRLFESLVAYDGLTRYLSSLAVHDGPNAEKEVKLNGLLAAVHVSSSLNSLIYEAITELKKNGKIKLNEKQISVFSKIFKPESFRLTSNEIEADFDPLLLEDIRLEVQKHIFNKIDAARLRADKSTDIQSLTVQDDIPSDLESLGVIGRFQLSNALNLTKRFNELSISFKKGYIVWEFPNSPTIYIKEGKGYFSPRTGRSIREAVRQKDAIVRLMNDVRPKVFCSICNSTDVSEVVLLENNSVGLVCRRCEKDSRVVRFLISSAPDALDEKNVS